jgi:hypothetical protein
MHHLHIGVKFQTKQGAAVAKKVHCVYISTNYASCTLILDMYAYTLQFTVQNPFLLFDCLSNWMDKAQTQDVLKKSLF